MSRADRILDDLHRAKAELTARFKVHEIGVFGSVARGEQREESDIDILVDLGEGADLLDLIGLSQFLEERLHHKVDVVPKEGNPGEGAQRGAIPVRDRSLYLKDILRAIESIETV